MAHVVLAVEPLASKADLASPLLYDRLAARVSRRWVEAVQNGREFWAL